MSIPQRFCRGVPVNRAARDQVLIYRLKDDLRAIGIEGFPTREVVPVPISAPIKGTPELELAAKLVTYCTLREERLAAEPVKVRNASAFLRSGLQQRLLSSTEAFWRTLGRHARTIEEARSEQRSRPLAAESDLDEVGLAAIGGGFDPDRELEADPDAVAKDQEDAAIFRNTASISSTSTSYGTRPASSNATDGSTASFSLRLRCIAGTSSMRTARKMRSSSESSRRPRPSIVSSADSRPCSTKGCTESRIEPVHMHLEHRISQRLLGRFQSQGFMYQDLSRACLAQTKGSLPLVYLLGRLCLFGHQATRLHEDVIAVCAEWSRPETRKGGLRPVDPESLPEVEFMRRLDDALLAGDTSRISDIKRQELLATANRDVRELQTHLQKKADELETKVRNDLARAGETEAENTCKLLETQDQRIDKELERREREEAAARTKAQEREVKAGPTLFAIEGEPKPLYDDRARRERAFVKRAMEKRKKDIVREIQEEPDRIRQRFAVQTVRLEPVGIVYLWPALG
jgi:hypothetical protein